MVRWCDGDEFQRNSTQNIIYFISIISINTLIHGYCNNHPVSTFFYHCIMRSGLSTRQGARKSGEPPPTMDDEKGDRPMVPAAYAAALSGDAPPGIIGANLDAAAADSDGASPMMGAGDDIDAATPGDVAAPIGDAPPTPREYSAVCTAVCAAIPAAAACMRDCSPSCCCRTHCRLVSASMRAACSSSDAFLRSPCCNGASSEARFKLKAPLSFFTIKI